MPEPSLGLIRAAQAGEPDALEELVRQHQHYIYSIAMSVLRNPTDAADLTQEAFIRLFRALSTYRGETKFTTWLYRLVYNLCLDELRRRKPASSLDATAFGDDDDGPTIQLADDDPLIDPAEVARRRELAREIRAALDQIEPTQQMALTLFYLQELKYEEIAQVTGWPLNTVKSHIRRGKIRLAQILGLHGEEPVGSAAGARREDTNLGA